MTSHSGLFMYLYILGTPLLLHLTTLQHKRRDHSAHVPESCAVVQTIAGIRMDCAAGGGQASARGLCELPNRARHGRTRALFRMLLFPALTSVQLAGNASFRWVLGASLASGLYLELNLADGFAHLFFRLHPGSGVDRKTVPCIPCNCAPCSPF